MTLVAEGEEIIAKQTTELSERAAASTLSGLYTVTRLGPRFISPVVNFVTSSEQAEAAWLRFIKAAFNFDRRRDLASIARLEKRALSLEEAIGKAGLASDEAAALRKEVQNHRLALRKLDDNGKALLQKLGAAGRRAASRRVGASANVTADLIAARIRVGFLDAFAQLSHAGHNLSADEQTFLLGWRKFSNTLGVDQEGGLRKGFDYLMANAEEVKAYRDELDRIEKVITNLTDADKLEKLQRALQAVRKSGIHSKLKGILGEIFTARWKDWRLVKSSYMDIARRSAAQLGSSWEAIEVRGGMFLGGKDTWDEAILLVNRSRVPPEAKLFLAAQIKAALEPRALDQTINDIAREAVQSELRIVLEDGGQEYFLLTPMPQGQPSHRWVLNASGGTYPTQDIAALQSKRVQVKQIPLPMSVDEFNVVADNIIRAFANLFD